MSATTQKYIHKNSFLLLTHQMQSSSPLGLICSHLFDTQYLKSKSVTSLTPNMSLGSIASNLGISIRNSLDTSDSSAVGSTTKVVIDRDGESSIGAVECLLGVLPGVGFNEDVGTLTGVDSIGDTEEVVVVDVAGSEAERWTARVDVEEVVVGVGDAEMSLVFRTVGIGMSNE